MQTLYEDSQFSENELTPVEGAAEDDAAVEAVRSQPGVPSQGPVAGELGPADGQAHVSTNDANRGPSVPLWEEPSPLSPSPAPEDPLQAVPSCSKAEVASTTEVASLC